MSVHEQAREAIQAALPGARVEVRGGGGHFEIEVVSEAFAGKRVLERHRLVLAAIAHLMKGDDAPIHAVDTIDARTP